MTKRGINQVCLLFFFEPLAKAFLPKNPKTNTGYLELRNFTSGVIFVKKLCLEYQFGPQYQ